MVYEKKHSTCQRLLYPEILWSSDFPSADSRLRFSALLSEQDASRNLVLRFGQKPTPSSSQTRQFSAVS